MQPNLITLAVDQLNDATLVDLALTRFDEYQNRAVYISESHSIAAPDTLTFYRTIPKPSGNFLGMAKTSYKFSRSITVAGADGSTLIAPQIVEVSFSNPVGATEAQRTEMRQRNVALSDRDDIMVPLNALQMI